MGRLFIRRPIIREYEHNYAYISEFFAYFVKFYACFFIHLC